MYLFKAILFQGFVWATSSDRPKTKKNNPILSQLPKHSSPTLERLILAKRKRPIMSLVRKNKIQLNTNTKAVCCLTKNQLACLGSTLTVWPS